MTVGGGVGGGCRRGKVWSLTTPTDVRRNPASRQPPGRRATKQARKQMDSTCAYERKILKRRSLWGPVGWSASEDLDIILRPFLNNCENIYVW